MKNKVKAMFVIAALTMPVMANAQQFTYKGEFRSFTVIPRSFSFNNTPHIVTIIESEEQRTVNIYNSEFEREKSFIVGEEMQWIDSWMDIDENDYCDESMRLTQTLFNDDEKYEYILPIRSQGAQDNETTGFRIMSEDGTELSRFYFDSLGLAYIDTAIKFGDNIYLAIHTMDMHYYTSNLFLFKVDRQSTSVKAVASLPAAITGRYTLDGKRLSAPQRGINITRHSDGTTQKVLIK
ncbi:MAG: hypothetical protein IK084_03705 [Bacteroidaceae bacterium]|nr:hypothetical protein [Bacteroidaceae bacterium]